MCVNTANFSVWLSIRSSFEFGADSGRFPKKGARPTLCRAILRTPVADHRSLCDTRWVRPQISMPIEYAQFGNVKQITICNCLLAMGIIYMPSIVGTKTASTHAGEIRSPATVVQRRNLSSESELRIRTRNPNSQQGTLANRPVASGVYLSPENCF